MSNFVHLHCHTDYSLLDGAAKIDNLVKRAKELNMGALAITDHGNMYGVLEFNEICKKHGIKPIIGCEFYISPNSRFDKDKDNKYNHLILLAKNTAGYKNLLKLSGISYKEGYYYKPRIDDESLEKYSEGLICSSACIAGSIPRFIIEGKYEKAKEKALYYKKIFKDDFYLEVQNHGIEKQKIANAGIFKLAKELNIKTIATNDSHYVNKDDWEAQSVIVCIGTQKKLKDSDRMEFETNEFYLKSYEEMAEIFKDNPEAITNTLEIAEKCNLELMEIGGILPNYPIPKEFKSANDYVIHIVEEGLKDRFSEITDEIKKRIQYELSVIFDLGGKSYAGYFLIVWDFIKYARENGIPVGPGRGSGAGSLVAYAMKITDVNPLKYDLLFERFLNPARVTLPDFDIDFCMEGREKVINYVREKYGEDKVAGIITFGKLKIKAVVKDVARVLDIPFDEANELSKIFPDSLLVKKISYTAKKENEVIEDININKKNELIANGYIVEKKEITVEKNIDDLPLSYVIENIPEFKKKRETNETYEKLFSIASKLQNLNRQASTHACGMVIGQKDIVEYVPTAIDTETKNILTQFTMDKLEKHGLVKMDFLGLKTLTIIKNTILMIKKTDPTFSEDKIDFEDQATFKMLANGESDCIFQFESDGMKKILKEDKPTCVEDMIALNALYRPGPMDWIPVYVAYKHNKKPNFNGDKKREESFKRLELLCKKNSQLNSILQPTHMIPIYQEQIMKIGELVGELTLGEADLMRRSMSKKKDLEKYRGIFIKGAIKTDKLSKDEAIFLFDDVIMPFSGYGFNKSHAAAYSILAFKTAYLKKHWPAEFMAANLTNEINGDPKKLAYYLAITKQMGIEIMSPNVNYSEQNFSVKNGKIFYGLNGIKGIGIIAVLNIIENREKKGKFSSLYDFLEKVDLRVCNKKVLESLILSGTMSTIEANRSRAEMYENLEKLTNYVQSKKNSLQNNQISLFENLEEELFPEPQYFNVKEWDINILLQHEKDILGYFASGHPLDKYKHILDIATYKSDVKDYPKNSTLKCFGYVKNLRSIRTKNNEYMAIFKLEDYNNLTSVVVFPRAWKNFSDKIKENEIIFFEALSGKDQIGEFQLVLEKTLEYNNVQPKEKKLLHIKLQQNYIPENLYKLKDEISNNQGDSNFSLHLPTDNTEKIINNSNYKIDINENFIDKIKKFNFIESVWISTDET